MYHQSIRSIVLSTGNNIGALIAIEQSDNVVKSGVGDGISTRRKRCHAEGRL